MNQFKQIFGLPSTISHTVRSSSLSRSAGSNGRDSARSRDILSGKRNADNSPELRLSGKSYARLIADYSKAIEGRNPATKCISEFTGRGLNIGFFSKTPFEPLPRVSSFVKVKNRGNNTGSSLSRKSSTRTLVAPNKTISNDTKSNYGLDETEILDQVTERADWLDQVVEAHKAKRATKNYGSPSNYTDKRNECEALVQIATNSIGHGNSEECFAPKDVPLTSRFPQNSNGVQNECSRTNLENKDGDARNVSVTVKPRQDSDAFGNEFDAKNISENAKFLVTVTEESKSSSHSDFSPLRHIDLRINGKPAIDADTIIRKVEKLDLVSLADKIEIKIPVFASTRENTAGEPRAPNSTINLCISSHVKGTIDCGSNDNPVKVSKAGNSQSGNSRPRSAHPSTFYITKRENGRKTVRSKVVPWWTTEESFRRSEITSVRSSESATVFKEAKTSAISEVVARGNNQKPSAGDDAKKVTISDAKMKIKTAVTEPSSSRQRLRTRRKGTTAISKIIENELRKKSEERPENAQQHVHPGVTKSVAKHETKVKTATNEPKKGTPSAIIDGTSTVKTDRTITPTLDKVSEKMPTTVSTRENAKTSIPKSTKELETRVLNGRETNDNSSNRKGSNHPKPITIVATNNDKIDEGGTATNTRNASKSGETSQPRQKVDDKPAIKVLPQLPRTYGNIKRLPTAQSVFESVNRLKPAHNHPAKENDGSINKRDAKHANVKSASTAIKPIEKKKDGTLIDYGLTVSTRKKPDRKLLDSQSTAGARSKKSSKNEEPTIVATIKEVIPRRDKDFRGSSINRGIVYPARLKQNGSAKRGQNKQRTPNRKHHPCWSRKSTPRLKTASTKDSKIFKTAKKSEKNPLNSSESKNIEDESPEKKLLYSVWLRRLKNRDDNDPDSSKDPRDS